ncbi:MAG: alpha/beta hydrolase-fold protein [Fimbriimonadales bacterium]
MKRLAAYALSALLGSVVTGIVVAQAGSQSNPDSFYKLGPDSMVKDGVPKGAIEGPFVSQSAAYPGTQHTYWIYVPAQYDPKKPAALMVFQDGHAHMGPDGGVRASVVMDNLIWRREIPVMIGVFVNPGRRPDQDEPSAQRGWGDGFTNRAQEYNALDDKYARVVTEEIMPEVERRFNISKDPEMRGIGGTSSGAIAAFTVAWERPNAFRKVLSIVGSFTNIRGGHQYPDLILKAKKKPLRVFLCDGRNDLRGMRDGKYDATWDWFLQNVRMKDALVKKRYEVNYTWGINGHGVAFGGQILPDMMRWLWRDAEAVSTDPNDSAERSLRTPPGQ